LTTWFWAKGYRILPLLGTSNAGFFYIQVEINGFFRIFSVICALHWLVWRDLFISLGAYLLQRSFGYFEDEDNEFKERSIIDFIAPFISWFALLQVIFAITLLFVAAEKMVQRNNLSPTTDLSALGQLIPFDVGVVGLCDAWLGILGHFVTKGDRVVSEREA